MSEIPYHGWTHRPKAQGGTDPVPIEAGGSLPYAYMRWVDSQAVAANTIFNPATGPSPDVPYDESLIYDPDGLAGFQCDRDTGIIDASELGLYYIHAHAEWNGTGSAGETLGVIIDKGSSGTFSTNRVHNSITADAVNQNIGITVSRFYFLGFGSLSVRALVYHTDAGGNDIGTVWIYIVQINSNVDGEFDP